MAEIREWATSEMGAVVIGASIGSLAGSFVTESVVSASRLSGAMGTGVKVVTGLGMSAALFYLGKKSGTDWTKYLLYGASVGVASGVGRDLIENAIPGGATIAASFRMSPQQRVTLQRLQADVKDHTPAGIKTITFRD